MDRKRLIGAGLCGLLFLGLGGCDSRQAETPVMKVDLETEDAGGQAVAEDVFRIERIVPLQAGGMLVSPDKMEWRDSLVYVMDGMQQALFVFNDAGRLKFQINRRGRGAGEYLSLSDFAVDDAGRIYLFDSSSRRILCHDAEGRHTGNLDVCAGTAFTFFDGGRIAVHCNILEENNLELYGADGAHAGSVAFAKEVPHMLVADGATVKESDGRLLFTNPFDYTVYEAGEDGSPVPICVFDFGNKSLTQDILEEKDVPALTRKVIGFRGVRFLKRVYCHEGRMFVTTDANEWFMADLENGEVTVFNDLKSPLRMLLSVPPHILPDGRFCTVLSDANMSQLRLVSGQYVESCPALKGLEGKVASDSEDYWLIAGRLDE